MQELINWIKASGALTNSDADRFMIYRADAEVNNLRLLEGNHTHQRPHHTNTQTIGKKQ